MATPPVIARARVRLGFLFRGFNFRGSPVNRENRENWLPRKFPAIRYVLYLSNSLTIYLINYYILYFTPFAPRVVCEKKKNNNNNAQNFEKSRNSCVFSIESFPLYGISVGEIDQSIALLVILECQYRENGK